MPMQGDFVKSVYSPLLERTMFSFVNSLERNATIIPAIAVAARYHRANDQEARLINPVAIPSGIPIIRPNPTRNEGAMATSGLLAREKRIMKESSPLKILGNGSISKKITVKADYFSTSAIKKIQDAGGTAEVVATIKK